MKNIIIAMGFLIPALFFTFPLVMGLSNVFLLLVLICFCLTFTSSYLKKEVWSWPGIWLLCLFGVILIGTLYTPAPWGWASVNLGKYAKFIYAAALMLLFIRFPEWQKRALWAFVAAMLFILASTWINVWFVLPWSVTKTPGWGLSHHVFGDYITQNVMMTFLVVFALSRVQRPWLSAESIFWSVVALLGAISITHLSSGRTGVLLLLSGLLTYMLVRFGGKRLWISLPALLLLMATIMGSSSVMRERIALGWKEFAQRDVDVMSSIGHRAYNYRIVPKLIAEKPITGHGTGAYHTEICRFVDKPEWCNIFRWHPHNQFLFFGADHGMIGIFLYVALLWSLFRVATQSENFQAKLLLASLTSILVLDSMINSPMYSSRESHFFLYMIALLVAMCRPVRIDNATDH
jgi:O-antigen ligase